MNVLRQALAASLKISSGCAKKIYDMFDGGKIKQDNSKIASWAGGDVKGDSQTKRALKLKVVLKTNSGGYTTSNDCKPSVILVQNLQKMSKPIQTQIVALVRQELVA